MSKGEFQDMRVYEEGTDHSDIAQIVNAIETEVEGSGNFIGYRQMHQRLRNDYGLVVQREIVREIIKELDPFRVQSRSSKRLRREDTVPKDLTTFGT